MSLSRISLALFACLSISATTAAQERRLSIATVAARCSGPGAALGVTSYHCASCGLSTDTDGLPVWSFGAEPVIMATTTGSGLRAGDVIEAVGGKPITTAEGAELFARPLGTAAWRTRTDSANGTVRRYMVAVTPLIVVDGVVQPSPAPEIAVRVRRDGKSLSFMVPVTKRCVDAAPAGPPTDWTRPPSAAQPPAAATGRFGLAVSCEPSCTKSRAQDGTEYWKYDGYPPIVALRSDSPAEVSGLRVGDQVTDVDGQSILTEDGALRFERAESRESMHLFVLRDGKKLGYLMKMPPIIKLVRPPRP